MSKELEKMSIISIVQKLKEDDVIILQKYIENLEKENEKLNHYKTLYQSLKRQKDEATKWVKNYMNEWDTNDEVRQELNDLLILLKEVE